MKMLSSSVASLMILSLLMLCGADKVEGNSRILGRVVNQRGQPMPNLVVKLYIPRGMKEKFPTTQPIKGGKNGYIEGGSDANGYFRFEKLPPGEYSLVSELDGTGRGKVDITVGRGQTVQAQIVLKSRRGETQ